MSMRYGSPTEILLKTGRTSPEKQVSHQKDVYRQIFSSKVVHTFALAALLYVGAEVTIGGNRRTARYFPPFTHKF